MATVRFRRGSVARYTMPMPPLPSWETISYGPSNVPTVRAMGVAIIDAGQPHCTAGFRCPSRFLRLRSPLESTRSSGSPNPDNYLALRPSSSSTMTWMLRVTPFMLLGAVYPAYFAGSVHDDAICSTVWPAA